MAGSYKKVVLSGGPSTGKSTMFELLRGVYPHAHFVEEAAQRVIARELEKTGEDPTYDPIMPVSRYRAFLPILMLQQRADEAAIPETASLVVMDRCVVDNLGYLAHNGITEPAEEVRQLAGIGNYAVVFFCDWLGKVETTAVRRETDEEGLAVHAHLEEAYRASGIPMIHLPAVSPEERLVIIRAEIDRITAFEA